MPKTLNGVGTRYWGSANPSIRADQCPACHAEADLRSYDTTRYFVLFFVPIVPLRKLRIIDECSACRTHGAMPLKEYEAAYLAEHGRPREETGGADWTGWIARTLWPLLVLGAFFGTWRSGSGLDVWFVNGLSQPYTMTVEGESLALAPGQVGSMRLRSGREYEVVSSAPGTDTLPIEPVKLSLDLAFSDILLGDLVPVVNPDGLARLARSESLYAADESLLGEDDSRFELLAGRTFYLFEDVDFVFEDFPDEISLPSGQDTAWRTQVDILDIDPMLTYNILASHDSEAALAYVERLARSTDEDPRLPQILAQAVDGDRFAAMVRDRLDARPPRVEWHRSYQQLRESEGRLTALVETYEKLLAELPDDPAAHYLLARVEPDWRRSQELLGRALELEPPSPWPFHGLAYQAMADGQWQGALRHAERALELGIEPHYYESVVASASLGARQYERLLELNREQQATLEEPDADLVGEEIRLLLADGRRAEAEQRREKAIAAIIDAGYGEQALAATTAFWDGQVALGAGDLESYRARLVDYYDGDTDFHIALLDRDWQAVIPALEEKIDEDAFDHLLVDLLADDEDREVRDRHRAAAREMLGEGTSTMRRLAAALESVSEGEIEELLHLTLPPEGKAIALACLARELGSRGEPLRRKARQLNVGIGLERHLVARALGGSGR